MYRLIVILVSGAAALATPGALAQAPAPSIPPSPAAEGNISYTSAFDGYRPYQEPQPLAWRDANDEAGMLGGHVGLMKASKAPPVNPARGGAVPTGSSAATSPPARPAAASTDKMPESDSTSKPLPHGGHPR